MGAFRTLTNRIWHHGTLVLLGDAAHTTHYSIGAGTTLALEDAIALASALREHAALPRALARYEHERKRALLPLQSAARYGAAPVQALAGPEGRTDRTGQGADRSPLGVSP